MRVVASDYRVEKTGVGFVSVLGAMPGYVREFLMGYQWPRTCENMSR